MAAWTARKSGSLVISAILCLLALACAGTARADLLGTALGTSSSCSYGAAQQPFTPWLDFASYTLVPGGSFESGAGAWTLMNGARVAPGNESFYAHSASDSRSLLLGDDGAAVTAPFCVGLVRPTLRFFVENDGSSSSTLHVRVVFRGLTSILGVLDGGTISAGARWQPSPLLLATLNAPVGTTSAQFVFSPDDSDGNWRIDDVYVDPWINR